MPKRLIDAPLSKQPFPIPPNARFRVVDAGHGNNVSNGEILSLVDGGTSNLPNLPICFNLAKKNGNIVGLYPHRLELLDKCAPKIVQGITLNDCEATRHEDVGKKIISKAPYRNSITGWLLAHRPNQCHLILCDDSWKGGEATNSEDEEYVPLGTERIAYVASYELVEETPEATETKKGMDVDRDYNSYWWLGPQATNDGKTCLQLSSFFQNEHEKNWWGQSFTKSKCVTQTLMNNVITAIKNLALTAEDKLLRKHGVEDSNGEITEKGYELSAYLSYKANRDAIVKHLKELDAEEEKKG